MRVVVPFAAETPKTRLESVLTPTERGAISRAMLADVLSAIVGAGHEPRIVSTAPLDLEALELPGEVTASASVTVDDRPLTEAVNARLPGSGDRDDADDDPDAVAVVMADLALATPESLSRLFETPGDVAVAPGRGGGTNALVVRHPDFRVDYHGASYRDHRRIAADADLSVGVVDSMRLATDVDEPADLAEVLIHGEGRASDWLADAGFDVVVREGRVGVGRSDGR